MAGEDEELVTYGGPEISLNDLAATPRDASGTWTVTDSAGATISLPLTRDKAHCGRQGSVSLSGPELTETQLSSLDGTSFTYRVDLRLDQTHYTATATWPKDELADEAPYVAFTLDPALPAYTG